MSWSLIVDWSGTLMDDLIPVWKTTNRVLVRCGFPPKSLEQFRTEFELPVSRCYARWAPGWPAEKLEEIFVEEYGPYRQEIAPLPATPLFLRRCKEERWPVFIASTVDPHTYHSQMQRYGLEHYITRAYLGIVDKTRTIHDILEENELDRRRTVFVGDMEHDIEAGKAGGVRTCAVLTGYTPEERLRARQPDWICAHIGELPEVLCGQDSPARP